MTSNLAQAIKRGTDSGAFTLPKGLAGKVKLTSAKAAAGKEVSTFSSLVVHRGTSEVFNDAIWPLFFPMKGRQQKTTRFL